MSDKELDETAKNVLQVLAEQVTKQQKDIQRALENSDKIDAVKDRSQEVKVQSLTIGNELIDVRQDQDKLEKVMKKDYENLKERDKELKAMIRELEQTSLWFRLRRKWRHITGKDAQ